MRIPLEPQQNLLSQIPVSTEQQTFGAEGEPGVQVVVPVTYSVPPNPGEHKTPSTRPVIPLPRG